MANSHKKTKQMCSIVATEADTLLRRSPEILQGLLQNQGQGSELLRKA